VLHFRFHLLIALQRYQQMKAEVEHAFARGGCLEGASLGGDDLSDELVRQLCDRCNDTMDPSFGSMIEWVLYEGGGPGTCWHWWEGCKKAARRGCYFVWLRTGAAA